MPYKDVEKQKQVTKDRQNRVRAQFRAYKESIPCVDCALFYPYYVMEFHHRNPRDKTFSISQRQSSFGSLKIQNEIGKCDLLCANCHRIREHGNLA